MALRMNDCWRCQSNDPQTYKFCEESVMHGVYYVRLCTPCKNDYQTYTDDDKSLTDLRERTRLNNIRGTIAREAKDEAAMVAQSKEADVIGKEWFKVAEAWAPKPIPKDKAATA